MIATNDELRDFKALHKNCEVVVITVADKHNPGIFGFKCVQHDRHIVTKMPYPMCEGKIECALAGYCKREHACNN